MSVSLKQLAAVLNTLRQFLKQYDKAVKFPASYNLPKSRQEIGYTLFKDEHFAPFFQDIKEHCNKQIGFFFVLSVTRSVVSASESFNMLVSKTFQQRLTIYVTAKCIAFTKTFFLLPQSVEFVTAIMKSDSNILAHVLYEDQRIVELIGDVFCPNKNC